MTKRLREGLLFVVALLTLAAGCSSGATMGGQQDNGLGQQQINQGQVPQSSSITVEGLLNQYDLPLDGVPCQKVLCIDAGYGIVPVLADQYGSVFVQIGFSSGIDEATFKRTPLNLSVVVDRSGSMDGSKMTSVKTALSRLIDQLGEGDRLSIVLFDDLVDVLVQPTMVGDKTALKNAVAKIAARGSTNMAAGLRKGSELVKLNAGQAGVSDRVMVFTDAQTNTGDTDQETFIQIATTDAAQNIGITLFGVGTDLNQSLAVAISNVRGGNYFFLQDATKIATVFDQDFDFLVTPLAYDLHMSLQPATGFTITAVYGVPSWRSGATTVDMVIPTIFLSHNHGAVVVRLDPTGRKWPLGQSPLAELSLNYTSSSDGVKVTDSLEASYSSTEPLTDSSIFYSQRAVRKSVALVNEAIAEIRATQMYYSGNVSGAITLLEQAHTMLLTEEAAIEDADLTTEASNVQKLESNMQKYTPSGYGTGGSYGGTSYNNNAQGMACAFAAGAKTSVGTSMLVLALLGLVRLARGRRR
jgi:Ca-activated chloride channel homolog